MATDHKRRELRARIGPVPCQACKVPVYWRGTKRGWCEASRLERHECAV